MAMFAAAAGHRSAAGMGETDRQTDGLIAALNGPHPPKAGNNDSSTATD